MKLTLEASVSAHQLHLLLKERGLAPKHHAYMIENRKVQPENPQFYQHFHPIQDLLKFLENEHANDDPSDQTMGDKFEFRVYSRRWERYDTYYLTRTEEGWDLQFLAINGPCDSAGHPFLYKNFEQDSIEYPAGLEHWLFSLWNRAKTEGLSHDEVQQGLRELSDWVSSTERNAPTEGIFQGSL